MKSLLGLAFTGVESLLGTRGRLRIAVIGAAAGGSVVALSAATALPPREIAAAAPVPQYQPADMPVTYVGAAAQGSEPQATPASASGDTSARRFTGTIGADLSRSLEAAGVPERQGREYVAVLGRAIPLRDGLSVDDRFDLVLERTPTGFGRLLFVGLDRIGRADVELLKWTDGKSTIWVNADGVGGETSAAIRLPVSGRVTSGFGSRFHPILGYARFHKGVDLGARMGTPIVAAADGRVVYAGWRGGYGREVAIAHAEGIQTAYGHMSRISASAGEMVRAGQVIGYVGSSGLSTGPHLHFEVTKHGRPVNPLSVKFASGPAQLQGERLHAFQDQLRQLLLVAG